MTTTEKPAGTPTRVEKAVGRYSASLYRLAFVWLGNAHDAQDAVQETFLRYMEKAPSFESDGHEKAWLITVTVNLCKNIRRQRAAHPWQDIDTVPEADAVGDTPLPDTPMLDALLTLPEMFRIPLTLHYVEGYKVEEIARMMHLTLSAVKMRLKKGRQLLKDAYEKGEKSE